jgi:flagellar assembly factor FliW
MPQLLDARPDAPAEGNVTLASDLLGAVELPAADVLDFPAGLPGFPAARRFVLVPAGRPGLFWLQSADAPGLVFLLADPFHWCPGYDLDVSDAELASLGAATAADLAVFAVVTLPAAPGEQASVNLRAPVLLSARTRQGRQVVLAGERHAVRAALALD